MKISLMTLNMLFVVFRKMQLSGDKEEAMEDYEEMLDVVKECGYEALDITEIEIDMFGIDYLKDQVRKRGLMVSSILCFAEFASMNDEDSAAIIETAKKAIDDSVVLKSKVVMMIPRAQKNISDYSRNELADRLVKHWAPTVVYAKEKGIHVVVEDTPDLKVPLCTVEELQYVLNRVPDLKIVYDSGNMLLVKEDPTTYYEAFAEHVAHIHLKDMRFADSTDIFADTSIDGKKMTGAATGKGLVDFKTLLEHIKAHGYDGYLTIEYVPEEDGDHRKGLRESIKLIKELLK